MTKPKLKVVAKPNDFFDDYLTFVDATESPLLYHRWSMLSAVGALLGRQCSLPLGHFTVYPNMYVCLMGNAGSRKSSAISIARKLVEDAGYCKFARAKTSSQKFIQDLGEGFDNIKRVRIDSGVTPLKDNEFVHEGEILDMDIMQMNVVAPDKPSEVYVVASELEDFLGQNDGAFISLLTNLWDNHDDYTHGKIANDDIYVVKPTINMIGATTPTTFASIFPPEVAGQGFLSRLIVVYGKGSRSKITFPPKPDVMQRNRIVAHLMKVKEKAKGEFTLSAGAAQVIDDIYQKDIVINDSRLDSYCSRRLTHLYKLCIIMSACELTTVISKEIAIKANTVLAWTESYMSTALGSFGKSVNSGLDQLVVDTLAKFPEGVTMAKLYTTLSKDFRTIKDMQLVMQDLMTTNKLIVAGGKLVGVKTKVLDNIPHVNYSLLQEFNNHEL